MIPDADLKLANSNIEAFKFAVKVGGKLNGNDTSSSSLKSAKVNHFWMVLQQLLLLTQLITNKL